MTYTNIELAKRCEFCNGIGEVTTMESVYPGGPDAHIQAPIGTEICDNCNGTGLEEDDEIVKERIIDNLTEEQENKLKEDYSKSYTGLDDDMSDKFEAWLFELTLEDLLKIIS